MDIVIKKNLSEKNKAVKNTTIVAELTGVLRSPASVVDPRILVEGEITTLANANYLTIPDFGRSYFIADIISVSNTMVEIVAHVDVLSSFYESIKDNKCIVRRQQLDYNLYLNDGVFRTYQNPIVLTKAFPAGFTTQNFVLAIAGS